MMSTRPKAPVLRRSPGHADGPDRRTQTTSLQTLVSQPSSVPMRPRPDGAGHDGEGPHDEATALMRSAKFSRGPALGTTPMNGAAAFAGRRGLDPGMRASRKRHGGADGEQRGGATRRWTLDDQPVACRAGTRCADRSREPMVAP